MKPGRPHALALSPSTLGGALILSLVALLAVPGCTHSGSAPAVSSETISEAQKQDDGEAEALVGLTYQLSPVERKGRHGMEIRLSFRGKNSGKTRILLPNRWANETGLYRAIQGLEVIAPEEARLERLPRPDIMTVEHPPGATVEVRYTILQDWEGEPAAHPYRPMWQADHFHFVGYGVWVQPEYKDSAKVPVTMRWEGFPEDWSLINSHGPVGGEAQRFEASPFELRHAIFVGGDFRLRQIDVHGQPVHVAVRGEWPFSDGEFAELIGGSVGAGREFWEDFDFPHFLVTLIPAGGPCCSYRGTALTDTFALIVGSDRGINDSFKHLLTHELFHTWNGQKMVVAQPERLMYWFSEGVTNYYTRLLNLRSGLIDLPTYVRETNRMLYEYATSPAKEASNDRILEAFWDDDNVRRLPYYRGDLLALSWSLRIHERSRGARSLDDAMRDLMSRAQEERVHLTNEIIDQVFRGYLPGGIEAELVRHVEKGEAIEPPAGVLGPCVNLSLQELGPHEAGFDVAATRSNDYVVTGVVEGSNAWKAGLRDGQRLQAISMRLGGYPPRPASLKIADEDGVREVRYLPVRGEYAVPQYVLDEELYEADPQTCLAFFGL